MVEVQKVRKVYGASDGTEVVAIKDVSVDFGEHGLVFILGKSGSGKSTLLHILGGIDRPSHGEIILDEKKFSAFTTREYDLYRNAYVGFVFQDFNLINEISVYENVALSLKLQGKKDVREDVLKALENVGISELVNRMPNELSGGQKQRVAIARAIVKNPKLILADEPTGALDSDNGENVFRILKEASKEKLVIVASHDRASAEAFGDRVIELKDGKIVKDTAYSSGANETSPSHTAEISSLKKARLPFLTAVKIALSNFSRKKFKLVSAIVTSSISFSMFGAFLSLIALNENHVIANGLNASTLPAVHIMKAAHNARRNTLTFDSEWNISTESVGDDEGERAMLFNNDDLVYLNQKGCEAAGVFSFASRDSVFLKNAEIAKPLDVYYGRRDKGFFAGFSDCGESYCAKHFTLQSGAYPSSSDEIAISSFKAEALLSIVDAGGKKIFSSIDDLLGSNIRIGTGGYGYYCDVSISGIYQTNGIPSKYEKLKTFPGYTNTMLANEFYDFKDNSFMEIAFVSPDFYVAHVDCFDYNRNSFNGARFGEEEAKSKYLDGIMSAKPFGRPEDKERYRISGVIPTTFFQKYIDEFDLYDISGNKIDSIELKDDEVLMPKNFANIVAVSKYKALLDDVYDLRVGNSSGKTYERLGRYSKDAYETFESDLFLSSIDLLKGSLDWPMELKKDRVQSAYTYLENSVDRYYDKLSKRDFLFQMAMTGDFNNVTRTSPYLRTLFNNRLNNEAKNEYKSLSSRLMSLRNDSEYLDFSEQEWERLDAWASDHYEEVFGTYNSLMDYSKAMPYSAAESFFRGDVDESDELMIAQRINEKYDGNHDRLLSEFLVGNVGDDDLEAMLRSMKLHHRDSGDLDLYEYGHFVERNSYIKSLDVFGEEDGFVHKTVGVVAYGSDDLSNILVASPTTLKKMGFSPSESSEIAIEVTSYTGAKNGKYLHVLAPSCLTTSQVKVMNDSFNGYSYLMIGERVTAIKRAISGTLAFKLIFIIIGALLLAISSFFLFGFIRDSVNNKEKEIGILRSMGASIADVFMVFALEATAISLVIGIFANAIGSIVVYGINKAFIVGAAYYQILEYGLTIVALVVGVSLIFSLLAAALPVLRACKRNAAEIVKDNE